jgi:hypothetical protein
VNKLVFSNGSVSITDRTATITTGGAAGVSYHGRYDTEAETERSGATATLEVYYTARPDGDGFAESEVSDVGETDTINRTLFYSTKYLADPDVSGDWTEYTTQPADNATFATAKAALLAGLNETDATAETRGTLPLSLKMVRTTSAAATELLLDSYPNAAAAYSVRKLDKDYTGYCMKVRRASDDAEADIGFDTNGDLDTAAIATHCGASAGYCSVWYDMSGNGNNATQSTAGNQPQIYNGTAVITENGKPALDTTAGSCGFSISFATAAANTYSVFHVSRINDSDNLWVMLSGNTGGQQLPRAQNNTNTNVSPGWTVSNWYKDGSSVSITTRNDVLTTYGNTQFLANYYGSPGADANQDVLLNRTSTDASYDTVGYHQEYVIWPSDQSSNRTGIESNVNGYFSIY